MSEPKLIDVFEESQASQVSIKIFYPDGTVAVFNDATRWGHSDGGKFWVETNKGKAAFYNLPHEIIDKHPRKPRTGNRAIKANF